MVWGVGLVYIAICCKTISCMISASLHYGTQNEAHIPSGLDSGGTQGLDAQLHTHTYAHTHITQVAVSKASQQSINALIREASAAWVIEPLGCTPTPVGSGVPLGQNQILPLYPLCSSMRATTTTPALPPRTAYPILPGVNHLCATTFDRPDSHQVQEFNANPLKGQGGGGFGNGMY